MKIFSSKLLFYGEKQERKMPAMRLFGGDKMRQTAPSSDFCDNYSAE